MAISLHQLRVHILGNYYGSLSEIKVLLPMLNFNGIGTVHDEEIKRNKVK